MQGITEPDDLQQCQSMQQEEFEVLEVWYFLN